MLTQMEHAEGWVLGKHSHDNNVAVFTAKKGFEDLILKIKVLNLQMY